jgi:hypothetical protein
MLVVLGLGLAGAAMVGACLPSKPLPGPYAPGVLPTAEPFECRFPPEKPCMRYRIPLVGNPSTDVALRNKYIAAFGTACYMSVVDTFDCFYKKWEDACADAVKIGEVSGNAPYDKGYTCQPVPGSKDYTLQVGSDVALKITINHQAAPLQSPMIEVNGVPTEVNGPYRNLPEPQKVEPGRAFFCTTQRDMILQANRDAHGGNIESDLQGFKYPCESGVCEEPVVLKDPNAKPPPPSNDPYRAEVHHVVRRTDKRSCPWGTNSNKNAAVISAKLNKHLYNTPPSADEVAQINAVPPSPP